ncbi:MAG: apolipoprotein N-acyltransferase [Deltaproteobacteria bacterium]|nr:apolipoprotein N-acyltransferase [Deltaproteobacteria bacterium]
MAQRTKAQRPANARPPVARSTIQRLIAALASTVCMVLCCPNYDLWWLGLVAWVPYLWAIEGLRPRRAMLYGWLVGTLTVLWGFFWLSNLLTKFAGLPMAAAFPITLLFSAWHGLIWGVAAMLIAWLRGRGAPLMVIAPMCWVVTEAFIPNLFPIYMALGWSWQPLWIQTAELGGVTFVSATMVGLNAALYLVIDGLLAGRGLDRRAAIVFAAWVIGIPAYGAIRISQVQTQMAAAPTMKIAAVQGNFSIREMRRRGEKIPILHREQALTAEYEQQGAELAVWGETSYPNARRFHRHSTRDLSEGDPWKVQQGFSIPVVFGAVTRDRTGKDKYPYNTAILLDGTGEIAGTYDKVYRLAFGEYFPIPFVDPETYLAHFPNAAHIAKGKGPDVLSVTTDTGTWRLGPFICYEDILPGFVRTAANEGVHVFVNLTNDAWFGKTHEPHQHLGLAVFRTVEHRKGMVRAVNTGVSTYIDPTGRAVAKTRVTDPDTEGPQPAEGVLAEVPMMDPQSQTLYGMTGELFNSLMLLGIVVMGWRTRKTASDPADTAANDAAGAEPDADADAPSREGDDGSAADDDDSSDESAAPPD